MKENYGIMDVGMPYKYVHVDSYARHRWETERIKDLIEEGCTGLIRYVPADVQGGGYGIPVKPVRQK